MTTPIVSDEEMTSLLGSPAAATPGLTPVTLGAPSPLSKEEERRFVAVFRESARAVGSSLGAMIRREIEAGVVSPRRRRFGDLVAGMSDATATIFGPGASPGAAGLALSIPLPDALAAVDLLLGGAPGASRSSGPPTPLESAVILELGDAIARALAAADPKGGARFSVETLVVDRESAPAMPAHETAIVVDVSVPFGDAPMKASAWIPESWLASAPAAAARRPGAVAVAGGGFLDLAAALSARLDVGWLTLGEALSLRSGDVIRLDPADTAQLCAGGIPVMEGTLIRDAEPVSFEVGAPIGTTSTTRRR